MRWLLRIWSEWRQVPPAEAEEHAAPPSRHQPANVPRQYWAFYDYLERRYATTVVLTFRDIEALLGFALPAAARVDRAWWTGTVTSADRHSEAWAAARRTANPNLAAQTVAFDRAR